MPEKPLVLSKRTISALAKVITGDPTKKGGHRIAPYRTGPAIIAFFNEFGFNDSYSWGGGQPSRWAIAEGNIEKLNGDPKLAKVIEEAFAPGCFRDTEFTVEGAVQYLDPYLRDDGHPGRSYCRWSCASAGRSDGIRGRSDG